MLSITSHMKVALGGEEYARVEGRMLRLYGSKNMFVM